jgi:DNA-binding PadR family transcriptional regulator
LNFFYVCRTILIMARGVNLGEFEGVVLLAVARLDGQGYGVTVHREIEARTGRSPALGAVYATLERLEAKGCVRSREGEKTPVRGGRARRHFALTAEGVRALRETRAALERLWEGLDLGPARKGAR